MKKLFILTILLLSQFSGAVFADECIEGNCVNGQGTYTFASGDTYVGEHKDGKKHGQGTYIYADGSSEKGIWRNDELIRDICEELGLHPGTEEFGQCVLKLMD